MKKIIFRRKDGLMRHFLATHNSSEEVDPSTPGSSGSSTPGTWKPWTCLSCKKSFYGKFNEM